MFNNWLKWLLKIGLTAGAFYLVSRQINSSKTYALLRGASLGWLLVASLLFNASKILSALRLNTYYRSVKLHLDNLTNLRLYYVGMFYNLFLPGGIGGDGYKVFLLNKNDHIPLKQIVLATLLDRLNGLAAVGYLVLLFAAFTPSITSYLAIPIGLYAGAILIALGAYWFISRWLWPLFLSVFWSSTLYSLGVQVFQLGCMICLMLAFGVSQHYTDYLFLFLLSSIASALPITIGGVGTRELVFISAAPLLPIDPERAVVTSLFFFLISALSSIPGAWLNPTSKSVNIP
jgi:glycosyltransferase 2 family protein